MSELLFGESGSALILPAGAEVDAAVHDASLSWKPLVVVCNSLFTL